MHARKLGLSLPLIFAMLALGFILALLGGGHPAGPALAHPVPAPLALSDVLPSSGGPDAFGYVYSDSLAAGGPIFNWVDIAQSGTSLVFPDPDESSALVILPDLVDFYDIKSDNLYVSTNGYVSFRAGQQMTQCLPLDRQPASTLAIRTSA